MWDERELSRISHLTGVDNGDFRQRQPVCEQENVGASTSNIHPVNHREKCLIVMSPDENKISMVSFDLREPYEEDSNEVILETQ